jgi:hypothetical protein
MKLYKSIEDFYLSHFYLVIPLAIILLSCVGGFAVYYITLKGMSLFNFTQMFLCVAGAMFYLTSILGQMPKRTSFIFYFMACFLSFFYWRLIYFFNQYSVLLFG